MQAIAPPKTLKVYALIKQIGLNFCPYTPPGSTTTLGSGFFMSLQEAEQNRTLAVLSDTGTLKQQFHVFELEVPNPVYTE